MCWPEANPDPVQGVAGPENTPPASLVPAAPPGPRSLGDCRVRPEQWLPKRLWPGTDPA